jgi:glycosyltransferase involved in cell wall biosynthesis
MQVPSLRVLEAFEPPDGGVPEHVKLLSAGLIERGHAVTVAGRSEAAPREALERGGADYVAVEMTGRFPDPIADRRALRRLTELVRDGGFDLVHAHGQKAGMLARTAARRAGVPSVYTPHSFVYRTQMVRPRPSGRLRFLVGRALERRLARRTAFIVAVAEDERQSAIGDRLAPAERIVVVHPGVRRPPEREPDPRLLAFRGEGPLLGFVAGLRDQKGLPVLLDALTSLAREGDPVRFAIVGNGPLRDEVAARVEAPPLAGSTLLLGFENGPYPYLDGLDAFVLPSLWEGLPMAVLEAMASGLPVIATAVNGTPEAVEDGVTGYLVPPGDPVALAARLRSLAGDEERRREMGEAARRAFEGRFDADQMVERLLAVYRSATAPGAPS